MTTQKKTESDPGDKISASLGYKIGLPKYSSADVHVSITIGQRAEETPAEAWERAWGIVARELDEAVSQVRRLTEKES